MDAAHKLGKYRILKEVGSGGLGQVFKAIDESSGRTVAVKILHKKFQMNKKRLGYFHRELLIVSRLRHKHIVEFLDANFDPPNCYIVSEFVDGWSLHALLKKVDKFPPLVALSIAIDMLQGIDYLHLHDVIHSDLSSPNVLVDKIGRVLVTDFGLAAQKNIEDYRNYVVGTPGYYSPEHVTDKAIMPQSDIYCVGLLLYEMLVGEKLVPGSRNRHDIVRQMKKVKFDKVICSDRKMQRLLRKLLKSVLRFNPMRRPKTAERMVFDIYKILRRYNIRYARYAVHQFLNDQGIAPPISGMRNQDIYQGHDSED